MRESAADYLNAANRILNHMRIQFGDLYLRRFEGINPADVAKEFAIVLTGLTVEQMAQGFEQMRSAKFCPTMGEFRGWCEVVIEKPPVIAAHLPYVPEKVNAAPMPDWFKKKHGCKV